MMLRRQPAARKVLFTPGIDSDFVFFAGPVSLEFDAPRSGRMLAVNRRWNRMTIFPVKALYAVGLIIPHNARK
jgi:hypothetical protein